MSVTTIWPGLAGVLQTSQVSITFFNQEVKVGAVLRTHWGHCQLSAIVSCLCFNIVSQTAQWYLWLASVFKINFKDAYAKCF